MKSAGFESMHFTVEGSEPAFRFAYFIVTSFIFKKLQHHLMLD